MDILGGTQETPKTGFRLYKMHHGQVAVNIIFSDYFETNNSNF